MAWHSSVLSQSTCLPAMSKQFSVKLVYTSEERYLLEHNFEWSYGKHFKCHKNVEWLNVGVFKTQPNIANNSSGKSVGKKTNKARHMAIDGHAIDVATNIYDNSFSQNKSEISVFYVIIIYRYDVGGGKQCCWCDFNRSSVRQTPVCAAEQPSSHFVSCHDRWGGGGREAQISIGQSRDKWRQALGYTSP